MKKVLAAGTFDLLHPGHIWFLQQAKKRGDHLTVIIARDKTVKKVKKITPHQTERQRLKALQNLGIADKIILGGLDKKINSVKKVRPHVICLGYDQKAFTKNLRKELVTMGLKPKIIRLPAYHPKKYKSSIMRAVGFVDIRTLDRTFVLDIRYATKNNFVGKKMYHQPRALLLQSVAQRLLKAHRILKKKGYRIKIWDCYRPLSVQKILWRKKPDERYVANPKKGSPHNRGTAIDCTLVDAKGKKLVMPTPFDAFTKKAHRSATHVSVQERKNMLILERAMKDAGFIPFPMEWWHFNDPEWKKHPLLDIPL
ncbi:M15 family metallopeptidase [Patescibacteria group bacterium]